MKYIASISFGKDSLAMLLLLIQKGYPLDEVVFYDTGVEFNSIYFIRDSVMCLLDSNNIKYTELYPQNTFEYLMFDKSIKYRDGSGFHNGYSWCGNKCRWGTNEKIKALDCYAEKENAFVYVGIALDEKERILKKRKPYKIYSLVEWGITESSCLKLCYDNGFEWLENGFRLYDILDRVSCYCCANKNLKELKNIYYYLPEYWDKLKEMQSRTNRPMKGYVNNIPKGVFELEQRFYNEGLQMSLYY